MLLSKYKKQLQKALKLVKRRIDSIKYKIKHLEDKCKEFFKNTKEIGKQKWKSIIFKKLNIKDLKQITSIPDKERRINESEYRETKKGKRFWDDGSPVKCSD